MKGWKRWAAAVLAVLLPGAVLYILASPWPDTPDGLFHLQRVRALAEALRWGVLTPRCFPDFAFGYGYPVLNFYGPAFYYPPALLHLAGLDLITAVRAVLALAYGLSGLAAYALLRRWSRPWPAALGACLYLAYPYRLYDLFVRGALPEFAAFLWLPLVALTSVRWVEKRSALAELSGPADLKSAPAGLPGSADLILAGLSWAGLTLTHNLSALMALGVDVLIALSAALVTLIRLIASWHPASCILRNRQAASGNRRSAMWLLLPPLLGLAFSAPYVLPALAESTWVGIGAVSETRGYAAHFAPLTGLFAWSPMYRYPDPSVPVVPAPGYAAVILVLAVGLATVPQARGRRSLLAAGGMLAALALWLTTDQSAWIWDLLAPFLGKLQFPWRWQTIAALALAFALALVLDLVDRAVSRTAHHILCLALPIALSAFLLAYAFAALHPLSASYTAADLTAQQMWAFDAQHGQVGATWAGEFLPRWVKEQRWAIGREPVGVEEQGDEGQVGEMQDAGRDEALGPVTVAERSQGYLHERLAYEAAEPAMLVFHSFYYPAWRVEVDGQPVPSGPVGELGLLWASVPAGRHELTRRWAATPAVWAGRAVWGAAWFSVGLLILRWPGRRRWIVAIWLLVGLLALVAAGHLLAAERPATPIGASYGFVRLESAAVMPARPGGWADVALTWLVIGPPEPVTAFVHVVGPDGLVLAQHDGPLGGLYTPAARWLPGELLPDAHSIPLPQDLAPGTYVLKAGLYRPGSPESPLSPSGWSGDNARVEIGKLEVRW